MSIIKKTVILLILSIFILGLTACNKSRNSNSSIADNSINITTEEANDITEEVTADTVTESTEDFDETNDKSKKTSKASSKKKDKESAKESTTETDSIDKEINKKTTTKATKDSSKNSNKSNPKTSNKESQKSSDKLTCSLKIECKEILDGNKGLLTALFCIDGVLQIEEIETLIAELVVILLDELRHEVELVLEFSGKALALGLNDDNLVYLLLLIAA